jgi:signal peptidase II
MLCILDQAIKLIIVRNLDVSLPLIGNWLRIEVQFNPGHILNDRGIFFDKWIAIIIFPLSIYIYRYAVFAKQDMRFVAVTILLFVAGAICNLTDKIIYNGTYDYIWVPNFVVLDLKDLFVEIGASILLQAAISLETKRIKGAKKEKKPSYITYELNNFKRWFYRKTDR